MKKYLLVLFAVLLLFTASSQNSQAADTTTLKIMTINLRHNSDFWEDRFPLIADEIVRLSPDVIGLQEVEIGVKQSRVLMKLIEERNPALKYNLHERLKYGAEMFNGEGIAIFSRMPIERKSSIDLEYGRPALFARIGVSDDIKIDMFNTHLHHRCEDSGRFLQADKITKLQKKINKGFLTFLTGDMNAIDSSSAIGNFMENGFIDTFKYLYGDRTPDVGNTSPVILSKDNAVQVFRKRIDYVFVKIPDAMKDRVRITDSVVCFKNHDADGLYPSDHLGVMTTFEIKNR
ncbi:MAG TPA: endonuclease/exonuclease/phosphatase family protein [bacterium]|nr:endonuclease/exonuclease/phosphatase family protein [bacterium]